MTLNLMFFKGSINFDAVAFNHRVCEQFVGNFCGKRFGLGLLGCVELELEVLPLPHVSDRTVPKRVKGVGDRATLRIENRWLQRHEHSRAH